MIQHHGAVQALPDPQPIAIGRYLLHRPIARGGMATIHLARSIGDQGFSRIVVAKRLLPELAGDVEFVAMFLDEARIASRIHHRNVVPVLDVVTADGQVVLIQDYVHGVPLHWLVRAARRNQMRVPLDIAVSIGCQVLAGLHAAHETRDELGAPLDIVHRDVSPQNVMVAVDGTARLLDFGVATATLAAHITREGQFKGKLAYAAPEQLRGHATRQSDLYSLTVLLWELIVGHHMHHALQTEVELIATVMGGKLPTIIEALTGERDAFGPEHWRALKALEPILKIGVALEVTDRWLTGADMEQALVDVMRPASLGDVAAWLKSLGREFIDKHDRVLAAEEVSWRRVGTTMRRRLVQAAGASPSEVLAAVEMPASEVPPQPEAPARPEPSAVAAPPAAVRAPFVVRSRLAILCSFVITLAIGIAFALRSPSARSSPVALPAEPVAPVAATARGSTQEAAAPRGEPATRPAATAATSPPAITVTAPTARPEPTQVIEVVPRHPVAPTRPPRTPSGPVAPPIKKPPVTVSTPVDRPTPPPPLPAESCNPPYYYEGPKKLFKPDCVPADDSKER